MAIKAYEGKGFTVSLRSMAGSTNYSWCITSMPNGVAFVGLDMVPLTTGIGLVDQVFYFAVLEAPTDKTVTLEFQLLCLSDYKESKETLTIEVEIIPYNEKKGFSQFVQYSENTAVYNIQQPYGFPDTKTVNNCGMLYAYPCITGNNSNDSSNCIVAYGVPDPRRLFPGGLKYGFCCKDC